MDALKLTLLGGFEVRSASGDVLSLSSNKAKALLAYLALTPGKPRARGQLMALLWSDRSEEQARTSLRQELVRLRKGLGTAARSAIRAKRGAVTLNSDSVEVDVVELERLVAEGTPASLERATGLYRGDFLDGIQVRDRAWDEWLLGERDRLRALAVGAVEKLLGEQAKGPSCEAAIETAKRLLELDPLKESAHRILMRLYAEQGERALALKQYETCRELLGGELGVEPEADTEQLYVGIRDTEFNGETLADERLLYRQESRDRSWLLTGLLTVLLVAGFYGWTWYDSYHEAERAVALERELVQAQAAVLEKARLAEEAQIVAVTLETEAKRREAEEAKKRAELERELAELERELARQESRLLTLKGGQAIAEEARRGNLERLRTEESAKKARLTKRINALEEERVSLERARMDLEQARAKVEAERAAELERLQAEEEARAAEVARERAVLEQERKRFEQARRQAEAERNTAIAQVREEEARKREVLEARVAKLKRQRDLLRRRLEALGAMVAHAPVLPAKEVGETVEATVDEAAEAESPQPDEAKQIAAIDAWKRTEVTLRRATTETRNGAAVENDLVSVSMAQSGAKSRDDERMRTLASIELPQAEQPAKATESAPYRIAIFRTGGHTSWRGAEYSLVKALESYMQRNSVLRMTFSYFSDARIGVHESELWNGAEPNIDAVVSVAKEHDVDGVVMGWLGGWTASSTQQNRLQSLKLYVIDVERREVHLIDGRPDRMASAVESAFSELLEGMRGYSLAQSVVEPRLERPADGEQQFASIVQSTVEQHAKSAESPPYRIALFPVSGKFGSTERGGEGSALVRAVESHIQSDGALNLAYSYRSDPRPGFQREEIWNGREPNVEAVIALAPKFDVQGVVIGWLGSPIGCCGFGSNLLKLYVTDVGTGEVYSADGHPDQAASMLKTVFSEFLDGVRESLLAQSAVEPRLEGQGEGLQQGVPKVQSQAEHESAPAELPTHRIAIFPVVSRGWLSPGGRHTGYARFDTLLVEALASYIRRNGALSLTYSPSPDIRAPVEREEVWKGREPNIDVVISRARELGAQGVVMGLLGNEVGQQGAGPGSLHLYVIDVSQRKVHHTEGHPDRAASIAKTVFSKFLEGVRAVGSPVEVATEGVAQLIE